MFGAGRRPPADYRSAPLRSPLTRGPVARPSRPARRPPEIVHRDPTLRGCAEQVGFSVRFKAFAPARCSEAWTGPGSNRPPATPLLPRHVGLSRVRAALGGTAVSRRLRPFAARRRRSYLTGGTAAKPAAAACDPVRPCPLVAQSDRAPDYGSGGWGFESSPAGQFSAVPRALAFISSFRPARTNTIDRAVRRPPAGFAAAPLNGDRVGPPSGYGRTRP